MTDWPRQSLGKVLDCLIDHRGKTVKKLGGDFQDSGVRVISAKNIKNSRIGDENLRYVSEEIFRKWMPNQLRRGDVLLTSEAPLGEMAYLESDLAACLGQRLIALRANPEVIDGRFLFYALSCGPSREELLSRATGTTVLGIRQAELVKVAIAVPPLPEQRAIAEVLGALDDKIQSNRRTAITGVQFCDSLLVAMDTKPVPLRDVAIITMGSSPPGSTYNETGKGLPFYQGVRDFGERSPSRRVWCTQPVRFGRSGSTLVSVRAPIGRLNRATEECCIGRGLAEVRSQRSDALVYYALRAASGAWAPFESEGTVFGAIKRSDLEAIEVEWPTSESKEEHELLMESVDELVGLLNSETEQLEVLRDALLPALLSGRLRTPAAAGLLDVS